MTYYNIKSHKNPGFHPLCRRYIFGKTTGQGQSEPNPNPPSILKGKNYSTDIDRYDRYDSCSRSNILGAKHSLRFRNI